jgi:16S rRNA C967 or C1407 C5-methylase (RsmB/RsmF family)/NOL1/NOP2/fmu family ribosome biogenesis protein
LCSTIIWQRKAKKKEMPSLPPQFLSSLKQEPGFDHDNFVSAHQDQSRVTSIRLNPFKSALLDFPIGSAVPWCEGAYYLEERPSFTLDPLFNSGAYYVQEAGSMFLHHALKTHHDFSQTTHVLDVCAAPGGKSTLLNSILSQESILVSNELVKNRSIILAEQMGKWGSANSIVVNTDPSKLSAAVSLFDIVVVDAPCSGSGLFRKQPEAINEWSPEAVVACSLRQKDILSTIVPELKEGALLFYSTCSYSFAENEAIVDWLKTEFSLNYLEIPIQEAWGIVDSGSGYRFYPDKTKSEGFFCALLMKMEGGQTATRRIKDQLIPANKEELAALNSFIEVDPGTLIKKNGFLFHMPEAVKKIVNQFDKQLYFKKAGICLGELKGKDVVPEHEFALSCVVANTVHRIELNKPQALQYLRKENMATMESKSGFTLMTYKGLGLGWAKLLPNRINNYLPNQARILMQD